MKRRNYGIYYLVMVGILLSLGALIGGFQYQLAQTSALIAETFRAENSLELASGDALRITERLNAATATLDWICLSAKKDGVAFFERRRGSCPSSFFQKEETISSPTNTSMEVRLTLHSSRPLEAVFGLSMFVQLLALAIIFGATRRLDELTHAENARIAELAAQVAHDIRSPLAALEVAASDISHLPNEKRLLIERAVSRVKDIANGLLDRYRAADQDARETAAGPRLLSDLVDAVIGEKCLRYGTYARVQIRADRRPASYGLFAEVQPTEFKSIVSNLIDNAVEALADGRGTVLVGLESRDGDAMLTVSDDGKGIPPEILSRLGQRGMTHGKPRGSGLGIYHARTRAEEWKGRLEIESTVGRGTTVRLTVPRAPTPEWFAAELMLAPGGVVAILDDDPSIHQVWHERLAAVGKTGGGVSVQHAADSKEFRQIAERLGPRVQQAIFLCDFELAGAEDTGLSLAEDLGLGRRTVLVTSHHEEAPVIEGCRRIGARLLPKYLAGLVPIRISTPGPSSGSTAQAVVLIDDDPLVRSTWALAAKKAGRTLRAYTSAAEFLAAVDGLDRTTPVYIDADLGCGEDGIDASRKIHALGFREIRLATGHPASSFPAGLTHLLGIVGKEPPWS